MLKLPKSLIFYFLLIISNIGFGQILNNAEWKLKSNANKPKVGDEITLVFDVKIKDGWHLYSSDFDPNVGPIVTTINFNKSALYQKVGALKAINPIKHFDEIFQGNVKYFEHKAQFTQKIKILSKNPEIIAKASFQTCEDNGSCVMGNKTLNVKIETSDSPQVDSANTSKITEVKADTQKTSTIISPAASANTITTNLKLTENNITPKEPEQSLWQFLLVAFAAGLASIFMPCIFPIMPMTVSFFTKQSHGKAKALFYGISIMAIFGLMGLITMAFGAPFLNFLSTHWIPNLIFFIIFILFGISLLGAFEIVLPHEMVNKIDRMSDKGGLIGIFFMALTLVVVSFSCTVPFVGSLLIAASQGQVMKPIYGMLAFGLPFTLVFGGLAMFPQYLKSLPKAGGWLNELKAVFGFLEFALALKFLSNIDLTYHFNLIHRNIFLVIWIVISVIIGLYILGLMRLPKDANLNKIGTTRIVFATIFFLFAAYMVPGVTGKSLGLLSGILPPIEHNANNVAVKLEKNMKVLPHNLVGFGDFDDAKEYAKKVNKPIIIDFSGFACANCRKMEENIWPMPEVLNTLKNDFVIASLYVDDKTELPAEKQYISKYDNTKKITIGDKNIDLEISKYNTNAQPYYVIVTPEGESLTTPVGFTDEKSFLEFLKKGKSQFK